MAATEEESRRLAEELINATNALSQFSGMLHGQSAEQLAASKADKDAAKAAAQFQARLDMATAAASALADVFVSYQKEVYKGGSANKAAASSIEAMGEAAKYAGAFIALLVPGGPLVKAAVAGLGLLASSLIKSSKLIAEQTDEIYKAYQDMAKAGAAGAGGMQDVFDGLQKVGLGTEKFGVYLKLVNENANDLAMFGGTVNKGRKIFENTMASFSTNQRVEMEQMGLNRDAQAEATMAYIKQQRLLTMGTKTQMDTSSAAVMRYIKETDELARITGATREEQQKLLDKAMSEEIFASFLDELESQGEEGKQRAAVIRANNVAAEKLLGPETARGIRDSLTGFVGASDASKKAFMASNGQVAEYADVMKNTTMTQEQGLKEFGKLNKSIADTYTEQQRGLAQMGVTEGIYGKVSENRRAVANDQLGIEKSLLKAEEERKKQLEDPATKKAAQAENNVRETQLAQQKLVNLGMNKYIDASLSASEANLKLAEAALKAAIWLGKMTGDAEKKKTQTLDQAKQTHGATTQTALEAADKARATAADKNATKEQKEAAQNDADRAAAESQQTAREQREAQLREASERRKKQKEERAAALLKPPAAAPAAPTAAAPAAPTAAAPAAPTAAEPAAPTAAPTAAASAGGRREMTLEELKAKREKLIASGPRTKNQQSIDSHAEQLKTIDAAISNATSGGGGAAPATRGMTGPESHTAVGSGGGTEEKPKLTRISSKSGPSTSVNEKYAPKFQGLIDWLDGQGYEINSLGGYVDRDVRGQPGVKSVHAHGGAIDINPSTNPMGSKLVTDMPADVASVAKQMGLGWGGNWTSSKDAMHFSVAKNEGGDIKLADGGIVPARPGGTRAVIGEGGVSEAVIPLKNGQLPVHIDSAVSFGGNNELRGYNAGAMTTDLAALEKIAGKLGAYDASTKMITDPKLWKEILQSGMLTNYELGMAQVGTKDLSSRVGSENVADAIAGRIKELIDTKKDSGEAIAQTRVEFADMMGKFYTDFFAKMQEEMRKENPLDAEMLATLKDISRTNAAAAGSSEKMLRYSQN